MTKKKKKLDLVFVFFSLKMGDPFISRDFATVVTRRITKLAFRGEKPSGNNGTRCTRLLPPNAEKGAYDADNSIYWPFFGGGEDPFCVYCRCIRVTSHDNIGCQGGRRGSQVLPPPIAVQDRNWPLR